MLFAELPNEVVLQISEHLTPQAISALSQTNLRYANLLKLPLYDSLIRPSATDAHRGQALCSLLLRGDKPLVQRLMRKNIIQLMRFRDVFEYIAVETQWSPQAIQVLLDSGFDPETKRGYGITSLMYAIFAEQETIVKLLLTYEKVRNSTAVDPMLDSPLHIAARCGVLEILRIVLETSTFDANLHGANGWTPLHHAAMFGEGASVSLLLAHPGINVNAVDDHLLTPLISAIRMNMVDPPRIVQLLIGDERVDVNMRENQGKTALHWAIIQRDEDIVRFLLKREDLNICLPDDSGLTPLDWGHKVHDPENGEYLDVFLADERVARWVRMKEEMEGRS